MLEKYLNLRGVQCLHVVRWMYYLLCWKCCENCCHKVRGRHEHGDDGALSEQRLAGERKEDFRNV